MLLAVISSEIVGIATNFANWRSASVVILRHYTAKWYVFYSEHCKNDISVHLPCGQLAKFSRIRILAFVRGPNFWICPMTRGVVWTHHYFACLARPEGFGYPD